MNQNTQPDPEHQARVQSAALQEMEALTQYLQGRVVALNVEVQTRDAELAKLRELITDQATELEALRAAASEAVEVPPEKVADDAPA